MNYIVDVLLSVLVLTYAYPYWVEFRDWVNHRLAVAKRCRLRRAAVRTNLRLYQRTGNSYYIERIRELGKGK